MAVGVGFGAGPRGKRPYPGKLTGKVIITCMVAAAGGLIFGYDIGISGGVTSMTPFLRRFFPEVYRKQQHETSTNQYCKFNSPTLTLFTSSLYLAALLASLVASSVTRKFGRKCSMLSGGFLFLAGAILNAAAMNVGMLIIGRVLLGFGIGFANQSTPLYLSEMAPYKYRGALNMLFQLTITIGILVANLLNYFFAKMESGQGWRWSLGCAIVPALFFIVGSFCLPETPNSLIERGKDDAAKNRLLILRGVPNVDEEFNDLIAASEASKKVQHPWTNLRKRKYRPQLTFAYLIPFFQQFSGMNVIMFYAPVLFKSMGFGDEASLMSAVITGVVNFGATFVSILAVDKFGRKVFFIEGGLQMLISQIVVAVLIGVKFGTTGDAVVLSKTYANTLVAFICVFVAGFAWSWGPLGWLVPSEIFPLEIRSAAQGINVSVNMLFTFLIAEIFMPMLCSFKFGLFIFFAFWIAIMTAFIALFFPETKGIPIEEMAQVWHGHWWWKRFVCEDGSDPPKGGDSFEITKDIV